MTMITMIKALLLCLVASLFITSQAWGAIAEVGAGSQRATTAFTHATQTSRTLAFPGNVTSGNVIFVVGSGDATLLAAGGVTKSAGTATIGTCTQLENTLTGLVKLFIAYCVVTGTGSLTMQVTLASADILDFSIDEFSGVDTSVPLDVDGGTVSDSSAGTTHTVGTVTTGVANALVIHVIAAFGDFTACTAGGSYTKIGNVDDSDGGSNFYGLCSEFQIVTTAQAYADDFTTTETIQARHYSASFKPTATSSTSATRIGAGCCNRMID